MDNRTIGHLGLFTFVVTLFAYLIVIPNTHVVEIPIFVAVIKAVAPLSFVAAFYGYIGRPMYDTFIVKWLK